MAKKELPISHVPPENLGREREFDEYVKSRSLPQVKEPTKRLTMDVPESLHRAVKTKCSSTGITIADKVRELLEEWVNVES